MFGMVPLNDEKKESQTALLIGEGPNRIGFASKLFKQPFEAIRRANVRMQMAIKVIEVEG